MNGAIGQLQTSDTALGHVRGDREPHLLLGNGFSRACREDIFAYGALFDRADFARLSPLARRSFDALRTRDFEIVMRALRSAARLLTLYAPQDRQLAARMTEDADGLREVLVRAIADNHPAWPGEIPAERYAACRRFLSHFRNIYTLNYDLLLYWALTQDEIPPQVSSDNGFRTPEEGEQEYVTWEPGRHGQKVYYLHGALHVFDGGTEVQKYTWCNTGFRLTDQVRAALDSGLYPIFVAEGESTHKFERIRHSDFLSKAYRSFQEIANALFVFGHSMAPNDEHIIRLLGRGRVSQLFVGLYGDPNSDQNQFIRRTAERLRGMRRARRPLAVEYYDAASARVWA